jgi:hypothetical protein
MGQARPTGKRKVATRKAATPAFLPASADQFVALTPASRSRIAKRAPARKPVAIRRPKGPRSTIWRRRTPKFVPESPSTLELVASSNEETILDDMADAPVESGSIPPILLEDDQPARIAESGAGTKFALGAESEPILSGPSAPVLPDAYGTGRLLLLPRDPHSLYTHWDLTLAQQRAYNRKSADRHLVVRIHSGGPVGKTEVETHVHPESRHWFIQAPHPAVCYVAELGYYDRRKQWTPIAVSAPATTPPETVASDKTVEFIRAPELPPDAYTPAVADWPKRPRQESSFADTGLAMTVSNSDAGPGRGTPQAHVEPASRSEPPVGEHVEVAQASVFPPQVGWIPALEPQSTTESLPPQSVCPQSWSERQERDLGAIIEQMRLSFLSSMEFASSSGGISSPSGTTPAEHGFWFQVNAELVIYGQTEPGAHVTLDSLPLELREDGTFSCRFALPDGDFATAIVARSQEGELRSARLTFRRSTESHGGVGEAIAPVTPPSLKGYIAG